MSYYNQQGGGYAGQPPYPGSQPPYGAPPSGYPSQPPYPPTMNQQGYPPTMAQQGYPQQGYPPQGYGAPPPQTHSPFPPQQHMGTPPYPPHAGHSPYPQQGYGPPPGGPPPPQQAPYGGPAPYGAPAPFAAPPSPGYAPNQVPQIDTTREADALRAAMKGFGTNERALIDVLPRLDPYQIASVRSTFSTRHRRNLLHDLEKETSGHFREGLLAIARGPLEQDVHNLHNAIAGLGTKETVLNDVLLARSNADMRAVCSLYQSTYHRSLLSDLQGDLSMKTERLFTMVVAANRAEETTPVIPQQTDADVGDLYRATEGHKIGTDQLTVCSILSSRSDGQIRAISLAYKAKYHRDLSAVLKKSFSGHMEAALVYMLEAAEDRAKHDAGLLEAAMKGLGTKDSLLVNRLVRVHWDRQRLGQCKGAYRHFFKKELAVRVREETSGDYMRLMVAVVESA